MLSFRTIKYILAWMLLWQDNMVSGSPLQIFEYFPQTAPVSSSEIILILCFIVLGIERFMIGEYTVKRSYFWGPLLMMALILVVSWIRGSWINWQFKTVYELHESILIPVYYFVFINFFREPGEWRVLPVLLILGCVAKAIDGVGIYFFSTSPVKSWGILQQWRDGFLLALGIVSAVLLMHYKGERLKWLRKVLLFSLPVFAFSLIASYRRTFFLALLVALVVLFITLPKGRKVKHGYYILGLVFLLSIFILATDPLGFIVRLVAGVMNPKDEGSAYVRLLEYPNILMNIYHNPIFGVPIGVQWTVYYHLPLIAVVTRFGCHNTYLYWPMRAGIFGLIAFFWFLGRLWKAILLQRFLLVKTEEQMFFSQLAIMTMVIYQFACLFGLLYADGAMIMIFLMAWLQLMIEAELNLVSIKNVRLFASIKQQKLIMRY
ncbi:MAG TPA: O-antigen ligase family protein [Candidatus Kapabacteria bacterium]|nr:O-antigen ligase family protein [Candidatus Kapabacteria bacterium]